MNSNNHEDSQGGNKTATFHCGILRFLLTVF